MATRACFACFLAGYSRALAWLLVAAVQVALLAGVGCSARAPAIQESDLDRIGKIYEAYAEATTTLQRPPKNMLELKPVLARRGNVDELTVSPRDGKPYVIVWGVNPNMAGFSLPPPLIVYEADGANGERYAYTVMGYSVITDEQFKEYGVATTPAP